MSTEPAPTGFLGSLFDFTFSEFITIRLVRVIYVLGLIMVGVAAVLILGQGFSLGFFVGLFSIVLAALVFLLSAMYLRVGLEVLVVVFKIAENVTKIADRHPTNEF